MLATLLVATVALTLPEDFNPELNMRGRVRSGERTHQSREAAGLAKQLVANGTPEDIELAVKVLEAVFSCQDLDPESKDYGNYRWYYEDDQVTDRNAAPFCLSSLIPMMLDHEGRLPDDTRKKSRESIRLALQAVANIDITLMYTNIAVKDFVNTILGGQLLDDPKILERGQKRFIGWMTLTDANGIPVEYNSPTYYRVTIRALSQLVRYASDPATQTRARTARARLGLSKALHIHPATGRMSGPHGRAYQPVINLEKSPHRGDIEKWIERGDMPEWIRHALDRQPEVMEIHETPLSAMDATISTQHTPSYSFGVATREYPYQANILFAYSTYPDSDRPGIIFSRFLTDDKWLGDFWHASDRSMSRHLLEEGHFRGVQNQGSAIGAYTLAVPFTGRKPSPVSAVKGTIAWTEHERIKEVRIGDTVVDSFPAEVPDGETVFVVSGNTYSAVRPIERSRVSGDTSARLAIKGTDLVLDMNSYKGETAEHDDLHEQAGGRLYCAYYFEIAERSEYADVQAFADRVRSGAIATTVSGFGKSAVLSISYVREDHELGIEIGADKWETKRRWNEAGDLGYPMMESSVARQNRTGRVTVGDVSLSCGPEAGWLFAPPGTNTVVAGYHGLKPAPLTLTLPNGKVEIESMSTGTIVWKDGRVSVDAIDLSGSPLVEGGHVE